MGIRERMAEKRARTLALARKLDAAGVVVHPVGAKVSIDELPIGSLVRLSTGVTLRIESIGVGSATVTVVATENRGWKQGDRTHIAPNAQLEKVR